MGFVIEIDLLSGRYDAAGAADRDSAEWPPHPARVFCALLAGARSENDFDALRWLERLSPPVVQAASDVDRLSRSSYVVTNVVEQKGTSQFHLGRGNALRTRSACAPGSAHIRLLWPEGDPDASDLEVLDRLARRVPYLGRSSGVAIVSCRAGCGTEAGLPSNGLVSYRPGSAAIAGGEILRVPYPGYVDDLVSQHQDGRPAWEVSRTVNYSCVDKVEPVVAQVRLASPYRDVIVMRFAGVRPDGRLVTRLTAALRRAVMARTSDPLPAALHGHGADGRPHVAFLALPDVGHGHADGHLLGMAAAVPEMAEEDRRTIIRGVLLGHTPNPIFGEGRHQFDLSVPGIGSVQLVHQPGLVHPWGARSERWQRGSRRWVSATPVVLDRFPRRGDVAEEVARCCVTAQLPPPIDVIVSESPLVSGGIRLRPNDLPAWCRGRVFRHVELGFADPVTGPVMVGAGRYLGLGLLAPVGDAREASR